MAMNRIPGENIYIGGIFSVKNKAALARANITHILSVLRLHQADEIFAPFQHHQIAVDDVDDENLLEHFPAAIRFIQSGLDSGGSVLVHCAMGKSRSATICIAYLLHQQPSSLTPSSLTPASALAILRESRPLCEPNEGFMEQLSLYHQMGCPDDVINHPIYSRWLYRREVEESVACGRGPELNSVLFEDDQSRRTAQIEDGPIEIKCRKCRRKLATTPFLIPHEPDKKMPHHSRLQNPSLNSTNTECAHIFLHPLTWMRPSLFPSGTTAESEPYSGSGLDNYSSTEIAPLSGRLICPNPACGSNIGKFAWAGMQCSCGKWVVPAMGVAKARIDIVDRSKTDAGGPRRNRLPPAVMGIRLPPSMRGLDMDAGGRGGNL